MSAGDIFGKSKNGRLKKMYKIVRFYADGRKKRTIKKGLTLEEVQAHCSLESTHEPGVWFDAYEET